MAYGKDIEIPTWLKVRHLLYTTDYRLLEYWIAFGPHGPRSVPPPGEAARVFWYTMAGVGISAVIFFLIRTQAADPPKTMTKEYQLQTNEYLKVCTSSSPIISQRGGDGHRLCELKLLMNMFTNIFLTYRNKIPSPSRVSHPKATKGREWYRAHSTRLHRPVYVLVTYKPMSCSFTASF